MVKVYAVALAVGVIGLLVVILGGAFAENLNREQADPGKRLGKTGRAAIGGLVGFGMAGLSAEFAPLDFDWAIALLLALTGGIAGAIWGYYGAGVADN
ncbi:MAG TPA: hypothetical protein VI193_01235 [Acidimicrobiia bacterium]